MLTKFLTLAAAAALIAGASVNANAQKAMAPGQQMQEKGSVSGSPGASGYAPGHLKKKKGSVKGTPGASGYAPGHATTGARVKSDTKVKAGGANANANIDADAKIRVR